MYLVDLAHQNNIAIIMDWVPGHFCNDAHGLRRFDGETLYESDNEKRRENWQWVQLTSTMVVVKCIAS